MYLFLGGVCVVGTVGVLECMCGYSFVLDGVWGVVILLVFG